MLMPMRHAAANQLGLKELIAIGVGGMIGGGIFSVLGLAVAVAGNAAPLAFLLGGLLALLAGYSYIRLALAFHSDGASFTYLEKAFPNHTFIGALTGWTVIVGYIGTLALYAFTFGAYTAELMHAVESSWIRHMLSITIIVIFSLINLRGARSSGQVEDMIVFSKVLLLGILALAGLSAVEEQRFEPFAAHGVASIIMAGALIFVAYEGFQLITNAVCEAARPKRNIPLAIYGSVAIVTTIYVLIAVIAVGSLDTQVMIEAEEYALAVAAEPALGNAGRILVCLAAMLATASAINATVFGASRMMADMAMHHEMPKPFSFRNREAAPWMAVLVIGLITVALTTLGGLEFIASFSSLTFLLVSLAVCSANWKLRAITAALPWLVIAGMALLTATIITLLFYLVLQSPHTLIAIGCMYLAVTVMTLVYHYHNGVIR